MANIVPRRNRNGGMPLVGDPFFDGFIDRFFAEPFMNVTAAIRADIREEKDRYLIDAEIPGVKKEDIELYVDDDTLVINVSQEEERKEESENYIRRERRSGKMQRRFYLNNVESENVSAEYTDGVLRVVLPKKPEAEPKNRRIDIR